MLRGARLEVELAKKLVKMSTLFDCGLKLLGRDRGM